MHRLVDRLYRSQFGDPLSYIYHGRRPAGRAPWAADPVFPTSIQAAGRLQEYRELVSDSPCLAADPVASLFILDRDHSAWEWGDFPNLTPPCARLWVEMRRPPAEAMTAAWQQHLPREWGWYFETAPDVTRFGAMLAARGIPPHPDTAWGMAAHLAIAAPGDQGESVIFPLWTTLLEVGSGGRLLGHPPGGFPFDVDPALIGSYEFQEGQAQFLIRPALLALSFMHWDGVGLSMVEPAPIAPHRRVRRKARHYTRDERFTPYQPHKYWEMDLAPAVDALRFEGQSGLAGLRAAVKTCGTRFHTRKSLGEIPAPKQLWIPDVKAERASSGLDVTLIDQEVPGEDSDGIAGGGGLGVQRPLPVLRVEDDPAPGGAAEPG
jgi:hypothetical protein